VEIRTGGGLGFRAALGDENELAFVFLNGAFNGGAAGVAADRKREDELGEEHNVLQGKNRQLEEFSVF